MRVGTYVLVAGLGICLLPVMASAQQEGQGEQAPAPLLAPAVPSEEQPTHEQLVKLFEEMGYVKMLDDSMRAAHEALRPQLQKQWDDLIAGDATLRSMTPEEKQKYKEVMNRFAEKSQSIYKSEQMVEDMIPIYQKHLSKSDVDGMIAFFQSPAGRHFISNQAAITQEYAPVVMRRMQEPQKAATADLTQEIQALIQAAQAEQSKASTSASGEQGGGHTTLLQRFESLATSFLNYYASGGSASAALKSVLKDQVTGQ